MLRHLSLRVDRPDPAPTTELESKMGFQISDFYLNAATISERLSDAFEIDPTQPPAPEQATRRLAAWCQSAANGDWGRFEARLLLDGLSLDFVRERFSNARAAPNKPVAQWLTDAIWIHEAFVSSAPRSRGLSESAERQRLNFEPCFYTLVFEAHQKLLAQSDPVAAQCFDESAHEDLKYQLLRQLSAQCSPAVSELFRDFKQINSLPASQPDQDALALQKKQEQQFISYFFQTGATALFKKKPVLLRLIACLTRQWIDESALLMHRYVKDFESFRHTFFLETCSQTLETRPVLRVLRIRPVKPNAHAHIVSTQILDLNNKIKIVYDSQNCMLDCQISLLVEKLNACHPPIDLKAVRMIAKEGYGWAEYIDGEIDVAVPKSAPFFLRMGAWFALLFLLRGSDLCNDQMVVLSEHPMLLNSGPLFDRPGLEASTVASENHTPSSDELSQSLLSLSRLPLFEYFYTEDSAKNNKRFSLFAKGFKGYLTFLLDVNKRKGLKFISNLLHTAPVRKSVRPLKFYNLLLTRLQDHRSMQDGVLWSAQLDFLARVSDVSSGHQKLWPFVLHEQDALTALSVPVFDLHAQSHQITSPKGINFLAETSNPFSHMIKRLNRLDPNEIDWQQKVLEFGLFAQIKYIRCEREQSKKIIDLPGDEKNKLFLREAITVAETIAILAVHENDFANWLSINELNRTIEPLKTDLYSGTAGLAIFLAAYAKITKQSRFKDLSLNALTYLRARIRAPDAMAFAEEVGI